MVQPPAQPAIKLAALLTRLATVERRLAAARDALDGVEPLTKRVTEIERRLSKIERLETHSRPSMAELRLPNVAAMVGQLHRPTDDEDTAPAVPLRPES